MTTSDDGTTAVEVLLANLHSAQFQGLPEDTNKLAWRLIATNPDRASQAEAYLALAIGSCRSPGGLTEAYDHANTALRNAVLACSDPILIVRCHVIVAEIERHRQNLDGWEQKVAEAANLAADKPRAYGYVSLVRGRKLLAEGNYAGAESELREAVGFLGQGSPAHIAAISIAHLAFCQFALPEPAAAAASHSQLLKLIASGVHNPVVLNARQLLKHMVYGHRAKACAASCGIGDGKKFELLMWI